jgi:hypothetical protein
MRDLYLFPEQIVRQEQYKDQIREAEHYRLIRAIAQPRSKPSHRVAKALRRPVGGLIEYLPILKPISRVRI